MNSRNMAPMSAPVSRFAISLRDVTMHRLPGIRQHELTQADGGDVHRFSVAVPASYDAKPRRRFPLLILVDACSIFGSAVEMSRLMAQTREIAECIMLCLETTTESDRDEGRLASFIFGQMQAWCREQYRVASVAPLVFSGRVGIACALAGQAGSTSPFSPPISIEQPNGADPVATVVSGLRRHLGTGHQYGSELAVLSKPIVSAAISALRPLFGRLQAKAPEALEQGGQHMLRAKSLERNFEIFAVLPPSFSESQGRKYGALFVLDANIELSTAAETAARLARSGEIDELIVIGIGVPRAEGPIEFGFRRFEEFSPPPDGYRFDDRLGRVFRALFATRGLDARQCVGKADQLYEFLVDELLPEVLGQLPIDETKIGLLGHSAGGTFVAYTLRQQRSPFSRYASISPGTGMSGSWLMREPQASKPPATAAQHVFFCLGGDEKTNLFCEIAGIPRTESLSSLVHKKQGRLEVAFECFDGETHSTVYAPAVAQALRSLYPAAKSILPSTACLPST